MVQGLESQNAVPPWDRQVPSLPRNPPQGAYPSPETAEHSQEGRGLEFFPAMSWQSAECGQLSNKDGGGLAMWWPWSGMWMPAVPTGASVELGRTAWGSVCIRPGNPDELPVTVSLLSLTVSDRSEAQFLHVLNRNTRCAGAVQRHDPGTVLGSGQGPAVPWSPASGRTGHRVQGARGM